MAISLGILTQHFQTNPIVSWNRECPKRRRCLSLLLSNFKLDDMQHPQRFLPKNLISAMVHRRWKEGIGEVKILGYAATPLRRKYCYDRQTPRTSSANFAWHKHKKRDSNRPAAVERTLTPRVRMRSESSAPQMSRIRNLATRVHKSLGISGYKNGTSNDPPNATVIHFEKENHRGISIIVSWLPMFPSPLREFIHKHYKTNYPLVVKHG